MLLWLQWRLCCSGSYCIFKKGECPDHFSSGWIYWDDAAPFIARTSQTSSGVYLVLIIIIIISESYTEYNEKNIKNTKIQEKMHKTHSHRQVNSVNYLELEQMAVNIQLMISVHSRCISGTKMMRRFNVINSNTDMLRYSWQLALIILTSTVLLCNDLWQ